MMDLNYYYIVLLFKVVIAEKGYFPEDFNAMGNNNLENEQLKMATYAPNNLNPSKIFYLGPKNNPTFPLENPELNQNNVILKNEIEDKLPALESKMGDFMDQDNFLSNNYPLAVSSKNDIFNDLTFTTNVSDNADRSVTYLGDFIKPSEIETNSIQEKEPKIIVDNITSYEKTIDIRDESDITKLTNNFDYNDPRSSEILSNFFLKLLGDNLKPEPDVRIEAVSSQVMPPHMTSLGLPKLSSNNLPIISANVQPSLLTNIILKNTPKHHHHNLRQNNLLLPKLQDGWHPNYYTNDFPNNRYIHTDIRESSINHLPFSLNRYNYYCAKCQNI